MRHTGLLDVNYATVNELVDAAGIGRAIAQGIVEFRQCAGQLQTLEELRQVPCMDEQAYERLRTAVTVQHPACVGKHCVDLNSASQAALRELPGVGDRLAAAIVERRKADGPFRELEELERVPGIDLALIGRIRPYVRVGP